MLTKGEIASCQNDSSNPHKNIVLFFLLPQSFPSFFLLCQKESIFASGALPFLMSILTMTNCLDIGDTYAPTGETLVVPWKDQKDIK